MKKKGIAALALMAVLIFFLMPKELHSKSRTKHYLVNLSVFYPFSINQSKYDTTNINLSLLYGHVGQVHGLDIAAGMSRVKDDIKGFQLAGLAGVCESDFIGGQVAGFFAVTGDDFSGVQVSGAINVSGEDFIGLQSSGLFNIAGDNGQGIQITGLFNIAGESFKGWQAGAFMNISGDEFQGIQSGGVFNIVGESCQGVQASGIINITGERFEGLQAAGIFNITGGDCDGLQGAGIFNVAGETLRGVQAAGVFNVAGERLSGLQLGTCNIAGTSGGVQIGLINVAGELDGLQLGLINYSHETYGIPVGLFNISKYDGRMRWTNWASNISGVNSGVKFIVKRVYSIVSVGGINLYRDINESLAYSFFYGVWFPLGDLTLNTDIGYMYLDNESLFRNLRGEVDQHVTMLRASLSLKLSSRLSLFGGVGLGCITDYGAPLSSSKLHPFFSAGLELF
jgi:hypothetical protein